MLVSRVCDTLRHNVHIGYLTQREREAVTPYGRLDNRAAGAERDLERADLASQQGRDTL